MSELYKKKGRGHKLPGSNAARNRAFGLGAGRKFVQLPIDLLESDAWKVAPSAVRDAVIRVALERIYNGGQNNGKLKVTHPNFHEVGIRRNSVRPTIQAAVELGFLDYTQGGIFDGFRIPSEFGLTFYPSCDGTPATNRYLKVTLPEAREIIHRLRPQSASNRAKAKTPSREANMRGEAVSSSEASVRAAS